MDNTTFEIIELLVKVIVLIFTAYILPVIREWIMNTLLDKKAYSLVSAAYQIMTDSPEANDAKKDYAVKGLRLFADKIGVKISDEQIVSLVESAYCLFKKEVLKK